MMDFGFAMRIASATVLFIFGLAKPSDVTLTEEQQGVISAATEYLKKQFNE
jgi:hypothetical protein